MSTSVLITGGCGYLGGRLAQFLSQKQGWRVRRGVRTEAPIARRSAAAGEVVIADVLDERALQQVCRGTDLVVHLAALNDAECTRSPEKAFIVNCVGTQKVVDAAVASGVSRLVYVSTAHIYGTPLVGTISEQSIPRPVSYYAITHRAAEDIVLAAHSQGRIEGAVLRLSNAFGAPVDPGVNAWMLLANSLCRDAVSKGALTLRSPGLDWRDFVPLSDVVMGLWHVLSMPAPLLGDGVFNLGGNAPMRIVDFARLVATRCRYVLQCAPPLNCPSAPDDLKAPCPIQYRCDKLMAAGFTPAGQAEEEIDELLRFCARNFGAVEAAQ